ncbi:MAG: 5-oxoprolinase subunit PxpB [Chloroflexota bacterium]|nr:5-oxoprolinase subunit PxpB [Chloroflexota bacterium]
MPGEPSTTHAVTIDQMGESALLVTLGEGISPRLNDHVHALAGNLRQLEIPGVLDIVPAYASILVTFDDAAVGQHQLSEHIHRSLTLQSPLDTSVPRTHAIPVAYGGENGPGLESLATTLGLTPIELVRRHTSRSYRVYFLGFMPGFAYLGGLDPTIAAPRLASPRVRVPAGSVGIAGEQTGVYPLTSPGGWQLIGRTGVELWDVERDPPALLAPRDEVRFVASEDVILHKPAVSNPVELGEPSSIPVFTVEAPGALTTVQDLGRPGYAHLGLSSGGAMDSLAVEVANTTLGNAADAAALEITWSGPTLRCQATTVIALAGRDLGCRVDGMLVPCGISWLVRAGSVIRFAGAQGRGARCYLAVAGGFSVPKVLGSRSTYLPGGFGGYAGRQLRSGDVLCSSTPTRSAAELAGRLNPNASHIAPPMTTLRYVPYLGQGCVAIGLREHADAITYEVSPASDRMGIRLLPEHDGALAWKGSELMSFGVPQGAIQLPPGGTPVVLGADHQTTGGYPVLGVVAKADWPLVAQLKPGAKVRLQQVTLEEARGMRSAVRTR